MKVPNRGQQPARNEISLSRLQNEGSQRLERVERTQYKSIKATE